MILQQKLENRPYNISIRTKEKVTNSLTIPDQGFNLKLAMEQYKRGTLIERVKGYYETHGMEVPDFSTMDRIQKLEALAEFRIMKNRAEANMVENTKKFKANQKLNKDVLEQKQKEEAGGGKSSDTGKPPDAK